MKFTEEASIPSSTRNTTRDPEFVTLVEAVEAAMNGGTAVKVSDLVEGQPIDEKAAKSFTTKVRNFVKVRANVEGNVGYTLLADGSLSLHKARERAPRKEGAKKPGPRPGTAKAKVEASV